MRLVTHCIESHDVKIRNGRSDMREYALAANTATKARSKGWARRPAHGEQYGAKYLPEYAAEIKTLFQAGARESSAKMGPAQMHQALKLNHPGLYSVPSESEIRTEISSLFAQQKEKKKKDGGDVDGDGEDDDDATDSGRGKRRSPIPASILSYLDKVLEEDNDAKPKDVLAMVKSKFGQVKLRDGSELADKVIKSKVSALKSARKAALKPTFELP